MLKPEQRKIFHKFLILEMAVQSLQRDFPIIENLKMSKVYLPILERLLKDITHDYYDSKRFLAKDKIRLVKVEKIDEYFSDVDRAKVVLQSSIFGENKYWVTTNCIL
ncbi:aconitate hydratase [Lysinibacillus sp. fkY74-1]|uniref:aconitate hydratase n=1 Tax=Lysinibacillus sp. RSDA_15 TaxID=3391421 RepID=UPI003A4E5D45